MNVIISIKPKYVESILLGNKKFEFRKVKFQRTDIDKIYIYSTYPVKRIVGYFKYDGIIEGTAIDIWNKTKNFSGTIAEFFFKYFHRRSTAYAIKINKLVIFSEPIDPKKIWSDFRAPQSFMYFEEEI